MLHCSSGKAPHKPHASPSLFNIGLLLAQVPLNFPFFFNKTYSFKELFCEYDYIKCDELIDEIRNYKLLIKERFKDEKNDPNRPLIKPSDLTGRYVTLKSFFSDKNLQDSSTHLCSVTQVIIWFFLSP